ncbi:MAG: DASS family sodium-coupled anion symporter [Lentisphaeria bacterium]|nr:DASS family sodium-coupled anion symporter [Lentisphaeria bacterium]
MGEIKGRYPDFKSYSTIVGCIAVAIGSYFFADVIGIEKESQKRMFVILITAIGFWSTSAIPPAATALLIFALEMMILGRPHGVLPQDFPDIDSTKPWALFLQPAASPILVLFFGGFVLAKAATKHGLDRRIAQVMLTPFGTRPNLILAGVMLITAVFSMFMSNTATTAMMLAIVTPIAVKMRKDEPYKKALLLAIPFAANIGGMGTIIGTPPNAVAVLALESAGIKIDFLQWMYIGVPMVVAMLIVVYFYLKIVFKPELGKVELNMGKSRLLDFKGTVVYIVFILTVLLWITEKFHGIPSAIVALFPAVIFTATGILVSRDINSLEWSVLILVGGGIALGVGMSHTKLAPLLIDLANLNEMTGLTILLAIGFVTLLMSNFMSNTAASNLLIPIGVSIAAGASPTVTDSTRLLTVEICLTIALTASLAQSLPISTPPNAMAYASGQLKTSDFIKYGTAISVIGYVVILLLAFKLIPILLGA